MTQSNWQERVYSVSRHRRAVGPGDLDALASSVLPKPPPGYPEFMATFGIGELSTWVRVYSPKQILAVVEEWRERVGDYYFWDNSDVLTKDQVVGAVCVADTVGGDEVIVLPEEPGAFYVLPQNEETIFRIGSTLGEAIVWFHTSGVLTRALEFWYFVPWVDRRAWSATPPQEDDLGESHRRMVEALMSSGLVEHRVDASPEEVEEDGFFTSLFMPSIGGKASVLNGENITVEHDVDAPAAEVSKLQDALEGADCDLSASKLRKAVPDPSV